MPKRKSNLASHVEYWSILNEDGDLDIDLEPKIPKEHLLKLYRILLLTREFEKRMVRLQRQGRLGTMVPSRGQEAASLGSCYALRKSDWVVPYFRETAGLLWRGWKMEQFVLYYGGYGKGFYIPKTNNDLPPSIPVATQILHAVGLAWAAKLKGDDSVALCYFGDGATSQGDFHEALNFASVYQLPVIFFCQNNQYAISLPVDRQTHSKTLAQKSLAYDFPGLQADGNDLLAVYAATAEAVGRARKGKGPTLIEAITYRLSVHTTADDPLRYRSAEEVRKWERGDPLPRFRRYLEEKGLIDEKKIQGWLMEIRGEIQEAVQKAEAQMKSNPLDMFDYIYAEPTAPLRAQKEELAEFLKITRMSETNH